MMSFALTLLYLFIHTSIMVVAAIIRKLHLSDVKSMSASNCPTTRHLQFNFYLYTVNLEEQTGYSLNAYNLGNNQIPLLSV